MTGKGNHGRVTQLSHGSSMDDEGRLLLATTGRGSRSKNATRLGLSARAYLDRQEARLQKNCSVVDVWRRVLPTMLYEHCRLASISGGVLRVEAEPGPYMHEMRMASGELLEHLQNRCRRAGVKKIVVVARCGASAAAHPSRRAGKGAPLLMNRTAR